MCTAKKILLRVLLGVGLLLAALWGIDWRQAWAALAGVDAGWLGLALLAVLGGLALKLGRWALLLSYYGLRCGLRDLGAAYFLGQAANILLPVRGGEVVRLGWLAARGAPPVETAATIALEKYLDLVMLSLALMLAVDAPVAELARSRATLFPLAAGLTAGLVALLWAGPPLWNHAKRAGWTVRLGERWVGRLERWLAGSFTLRQPRRLLPALGVSLLTWGVMWLTNLALLRALGLPALGQAGLLVLVLVYLGLLPALMPGNVGPFVYFAWLALQPFGIPDPQRLAFAILLHALVTLPPLLLAGGFALARGKITGIKGIKGMD